MQRKVRTGSDLPAGILPRQDPPQRGQRRFPESGPLSQGGWRRRRAARSLKGRDGGQIKKRREYSLRLLAAASREVSLPQAAVSSSLPLRRRKGIDPLGPAHFFFRDVPAQQPF